MKNHSKSILVIIMMFLMAISVPEAFAQGKVTRTKKQRTETTRKPAKPKQKQSKPKHAQETKPEPVQYSEPSGFFNGHGYVDLGLPSGLKWATCNVGAASPEGYGDYFAWGETRAKTAYTLDNSLTNGKSLSDLQSGGIINSSGELNKSYDAASFNWGSLWRMPTEAELKELVNSCTWTWTTQRGANGYKVTGPNGESIFLPAAGDRSGSSLYKAGEHGYYWSSSVSDHTDGACLLYFDSGDRSVLWIYRNNGYPVRPVSE